jgi:ABC-type phosphate/phosphonate transport system substrate-binding protein
VSIDAAPDALRIASLAMYRDPPEIAAATRAFWAWLRETLRGSGVSDVPEQLDETITHNAAWHDLRLLIAQTCGYPLAVQLRGNVRIIATPAYDHPGCQGALNGSFVIVRADAPGITVADWRGTVAAINDPASNSGMNLLRHTIAPHGIGGRFFSRVIESGGHVASIVMVAQGQADIAAIDCVTYGNLARFAPEAVSGVRVLAETAKTPGLPFITRAEASDAEVEALRDALLAFAQAPETADVRQTLGLSGFEVLPLSAYDAVLAIEAEAIALGYLTLA